MTIINHIQMHFFTFSFSNCAVLHYKQHYQTSACEKHVTYHVRFPTINHKYIITNWAAAWQNQQNDVRPAKTLISLGIHPVWSESSLSAWRSPGSLAILRVHSEDSDQTGWMPRLIWVFAGRTGHIVGFVMLRLNFWCYPIRSCVLLASALEYRFQA